MIQEYLKLNKNILVAFAASIGISAVIAQSLSEQSDHLNTTYTTISDYVVYFTVFGGMFYLENKAKYRKTGRKQLYCDLKKLITSLGIAEVIYTIARWFLQYYLLVMGHDPYMASLISQATSTILYMGVMNLSVKLTRLYK